MTNEAAEIVAGSARVIALSMGMMSENMQRMACNQSMAYTEKDFADLVQENGIEYNNVITKLYR